MNTNAFNWRGNQIDFADSKVVFFLIVAIAFLVLFLIYILRFKIRNFYNDHPIIIKYLFKFVAIAIFLFSWVSRVVVLESYDYIYKWEYLPLHLCRLMMVVVVVVLFFNKIEYIRFFVIPSFLGAFLALLFADISRTNDTILDDLAYNKGSTITWSRQGIDWGYDSYLFWEYLITHLIVLIFPFLLQMMQSNKFRITSKVVLQSAFIIFVCVILMFTLNWTFSAVSESTHNIKYQIAYNANWFYFGKKGLAVLGVISQWPYQLFGLSIIFFLAFWIIWIITIFIKSFEFEDKKIRLHNFKTTFKDNWERFDNFFNFKQGCLHEID
ncbi:YwaF family protein [Mesomycoplasma hyorhinis]|uniref:YwaF family protein n=1 Tax=Mesomycoplasma hyorhinis TaxID=2100 RepID=UPI0011B36890|nr:integral membrane protein [Mesomycoplasma hyorhinis]